MKKKKVIKINIILPNKLFYVFVAIGILIIAGVGVFAYNSGGPANFVGHNSDELEVDWNDLENIPSGFADKVDNYRLNVDGLGGGAINGNLNLNGNLDVLGGADGKALLQLAPIKSSKGLPSCNYENQGTLAGLQNEIQNKEYICLMWCSMKTDGSGTYDWSLITCGTS